jgi:hypothetical protein
MVGSAPAVLTVQLSCVVCHLPAHCRSLARLCLSCNCLCYPGAGDELAGLAVELEQLRAIEVEGAIWDQAAVKSLLRLTTALHARGLRGVKVALV